MIFEKGDKIKVTSETYKNAGMIMCNETIHLDIEVPYTFIAIQDDMIWVEEFGLPFKKEMFVKG